MTRLREAHAHIAEHGRTMEMEALEGCRSLEACLERVAAAASRTPPDRWVLGYGLRIEGWREPRWPTRPELDDAAGGRPVCLWSFDYHALIVNSAAMERAGISESTPDPEHGRIVRDEAGRPTGVMLEAAAKQVWAAAPAPSEAERREQVLAAVKDLAGHGFTEVHDLLAPTWLGPLLADLDDQGLLPVRTWVYPRLEELDAVLPTAAAWQRERVRLAGAKVFADGTLNSRTASMLTPYADPIPGMPRGQAMMSVEDLRAAIERVLGHGLGLAVHAIGDAAVRAALDAWEPYSRGDRRVRRAPGGPATVGAAGEFPAMRIEHAEVIDRDDVPRFAAMGVVCSVQPCHLLADVEALQRGVPHRLDRVFPLRELIDAGCTPGDLLWFGSDTPIVRPHPEDSLHAAVHRRRPGAPEQEAIAPGQAISATEARACFGPGPVTRRYAS